MTREEAIEVLIDRYNSGVIRSRTNDDEWRLATDTAIVALRDMLKRSEGCDFCNESERIQNQYGDIMEMDEGVLILDTEGYPRVTFRIKYCPDCGRELSGNAEQVKEGGK